MQKPAADPTPARPALLPPPIPDGQAGQAALRALIEQRNPLAALEAIRAVTGDIFQAPLPGFKPVFLVGPQANRFVTVSGRDDLRWRTEGDPVTRLLNHGVLVTDGDLHDRLRRIMNPSMHKTLLGSFVQGMLAGTDRVLSTWQDHAQVDMLVAMRQAALLILMDCLYKVDFAPDLDRLWHAIIGNIKYISPGIWVLWSAAPRPWYRRALSQMDRYLYQVIAARRAGAAQAGDLLGMLLAADLDDELIRDQLLTMLIAGHDTSTALLSWTLYLLGCHPWAYEQVRAEIDQVCGSDAVLSLEQLGRLEYLEKVLQEALRLYPPIHMGSRRAACDLEFNGYALPAGTRVVYSIYLSHRHPDYWPEPGRFDPERFAPAAVQQRPHYVYVPFGGGPRNCIGMAFAQVEVKAVLARIFQKFDLSLSPEQATRIRPYMGATLEPSPGVLMQVRRRR